MAKMTGSEETELEMLREFYRSWREFHAVANIVGATHQQKAAHIQNILDISHSIELLRKPVIEMANG